VKVEVEEIVVPASADQDRAACFEIADGVVLVVADGAGGTSGGAVAAEAVVRAVGAAVRAQRLGDWLAVLSAVDAELAGAGLTTAVIVEVRGTDVVGASVGDSACHVFGAARLDLTASQWSKPLLGSGRATPLDFRATLAPGDVLVLASDGLFRYAPPSKVEELARAGCSPPELVDLVRLQNGSLQDDVAILMCRLSSPGTSVFKTT
jgi:serine/threonine protein phosphatase PrpC